MAALLSQDHVARFRRDGWCLVSPFFDAREVRALAAEVARFQRQGLLRNLRTDGDGRTRSGSRANLQLIPLHDKSDLIRALPFAPKVAGAVSHLIGDPFILHLDQLFLKPGRVGTGTDWHQDNAYFRIDDPLKGTAMWVAVHDATAANGTLRLIPGSHRRSYAHERDPYSDHHIHCSPPEDEALAVEVEAGGVVFFCYGVAHSTGDNATEEERAGMAFHFLHGDFAAVDLVDPGRDHRPWITGPQASGGLREYGVALGSGAFDAEVRKLEAAA